jgi:hypothetical protein
MTSLDSSHKSQYQFSSEYNTMYSTYVHTIHRPLTRSGIVTTTKLSSSCGSHDHILKIVRSLSSRSSMTEFTMRERPLFLLSECYLYRIIHCKYLYSMEYLQCMYAVSQYIYSPILTKLKSPYALFIRLYVRPLVKSTAMLFRTRKDLKFTQRKNSPPSPKNHASLKNHWVQKSEFVAVEHSGRWAVDRRWMDQGRIQD